MTAPLILAATLADGIFADPVDAAAIVARADAAGIDVLVIGDGSEDGFDPLVAAAWAAPIVRRAGLAPRISTATCLPFHVARALSALDFLTGGRSGWHVVRGPDEPGPQAADFIAATQSLWDSWDDDALIIDAASGRYLDPDKVRRADYRGPFFRVQGPLNAARPPQGHLPLIGDDGDAAWNAAGAEVLIAGNGPRPAGAARVLRRATIAMTADEIAAQQAQGTLDGVHFAVRGAAELDAFIAQLIAPLYARRPQPDEAGPSLRQRFGLPPVAVPARAAVPETVR